MTQGRQGGGGGRMDFGALAARLLGLADALVPAWCPDGKREGNEWVARNPTRTDNRRGSFKINLGSGAWLDAATGDKGRDLISLRAYLTGARNGDAARELAADYAADLTPAGEAGAAPAGERGARPAGAPAASGAPAPAAREEWVCLAPVPDDAPPAPAEHPRLGRPSARWVYRDGAGLVRCWVCRFDGPDGKDVLPLTFCERTRDGRRAWRWKALPAPRPLYRLDALVAQPDAPVLWCEGEKAAEAGQLLLPDYVATTHSGGAKAWRQADYQALAGRAVLVWPDADAPGLEVAAQLTGHLQGLGCAVTWVKVPAGVPAGWDAADALAQGWTAQSVAGMAAAGELEVPPPGPAGRRGREVRTPAAAFAAPRAVAPWPATVPLDAATGQPWPEIVGPWHLSATGLVDLKGDLLAPRPLWVEALTEAQNGDDGIVLRYFDRRWRLRRVAMPVGLLHKQAGIMGEFLHLAGCMTMPGKEKWVARYLLDQEQRCSRFVVSTSRLGWFSAGSGLAFVLGDRVIGGTGEEVVYQSDIPLSYAESLTAAGTLAQWRAAVAAPCTGNPFLMFAVMAALAGPLLKPLGEPSGGWHFYGRTTGGKTTMGQVAASVWGCGTDPSEDAAKSSVRKWDLTATSMETLAELHSHQVLVLDDAGQTEIEDVGQMAYKLASGRGKERGLPGGGLRPARTWQTMIISNGEISLARLSEQRAKRRMVGGQLLRMVDIPVDRDDGARGVVEDAHGQDPKAFVESLKRACETSYGTAGPALVEYLLGLAGSDGMLGLAGVLGAQLEIAETLLAHEAGAALPVEARRVLRRFAVVLLAGVHAGEVPHEGRRAGAGIVPWTRAQVVAAVVTVLRAWLADQGAERSDVVLGLNHLREQLLRHAVRFQKLDVETPPQQRLGWRGEDWWLVLPSALPELCDVWDPLLLVRELDRLGLLKHEDGRLTKKAPRTADMERRANVYWISTRFLGELADD